MTKKKLRDCTYGEVKLFCKSKPGNFCEHCPLGDGWACRLYECPCNTKEELLDKEIELPDNEH